MLIDGAIHSRRLASGFVVGILVLFLTGTSRAQAPHSLFTTQTPQLTGLSDGPGVNYELGLRFLSNTAGEVTAIRFWKDANESGTHTGRLWTASGGLLASVVFTGESASGWQQQALPSPVAISADVEYVVTVNTGNTFYVVTGGGLSQQITNGNLRSVVGGNGVFGAAGQFPTSSWQNGNYFRDLVFQPQPVGTLGIAGSALPAALAAGATVTLSGAASQSATVSGTGSYQFSGLSNGAYTVRPAKPQVRFLPPSQAVTLSGGGATGIDFTALAAQTLFTTQTPATDGANDGVNYEMGLRFTSTLAGEIHAIRFWKASGESGTHVGRIWSASGNLLASVTFQGETGTGWQEQPLSPPLPIVANSTYVASVNTGNGFYVVTGAGLASQIVNGDLRSVVGQNGVYGPAGQFPTSSFQDGNYFRDLVLTADTSGGQNRFSLSGNITPGADGSGATIVLGGDAAVTATAGPTGAFSLSGLPSGTYTLTPVKTGFRFNPPSRSVTISGGSQSGLDFGAFLAETLFTTQVPAQVDINEGTGYELGTRFTSTLAGRIHALRFWKGPTETGVHVGKLWSGSGQLLASVTFQNETASGWQEQVLTTAIPIAANAEYTVSVNTGNNHYSATDGGLAQQVVNGNLRSVVGGNGVYGSPGAYPTLSYFDGNYFRDVILTSDPTPLPNRFAIAGGITPAGDGAGATVTLSGAVSLTATANASGVFSFSGLPDGAYTVRPTKTGYTFTPESLSVTVAGAEVSGVNFAAQLKQTLFTTQTPAQQNLADGVNYEMGLRFRSDLAAEISGLRFWKGSSEASGHVGRLWSASGQLLAQVTFQNETASGWQEQALPAPHPIVAGAEYVVSVATTNQFYVATHGGLAQEIVNTPLRSVVGQNGLYGPAGQFPTQSFQAGNYFRDVVLTGDDRPRYSISGSITPAGDGAGATVLLTGDTQVSTTADPSGTFSFGGIPDGAYVVTPQKSGYLFQPGSRTVTVSGANVSGVNFTATLLPPTETIFTTQTPAQQGLNDGVLYELGTKFYSVVNGEILAVRFWKSPSEAGTSHIGRIWSANGQLLGSVTFTNETASGWQEQSLPAPVSVDAYTQYTVSVNTGGGFYVGTAAGLAQQVASGNLRTVTGINGAYGAVNQAPWEGLTENYFRDVKFTPTPAPPAQGLRISGTVTPADISNAVTITLSGGATGTVRTDTAGSYVAGGLSAGTITVTPSKPGFAFTPASRTVVLTTSNATGIDFTAQAANPIVAENARAGTSAWQLVNQAELGEIEGFAGPTTVNRGETVTFRVDSNGAPYTLDVYRLGWYGGLGGRLVHAAGTLSGSSQPSCPPDPTYGLSDCNWSVSHSLATGSSWTSGLYVAKVRLTGTGKENQIWFVVRNDASTADILYQTSTTTMQAYNAWGGKSVYAGKSSGEVPAESSSTAAVKVSFNRPFQPFSRYGTPSQNPYLDQHLRWDASWIRWVESQGYDLSYSSNLDTHFRGQHILQHDVFLATGHDEYWSSQMRNNLEAAFAAGVHMAIFSANVGYWQVRFENSPNGGPNPVMVSYKSNASTFDPLFTNPAMATVRFRDEPVNRPENRFFGVMYGWDTTDWSGYPLVVTSSQHALYRHTGLANGNTIFGLVGYEWDNREGVTVDEPNPPSIPGLQLLSNSPTTPGSYQHAAFYQNAAGARMFAAGTINWGWALDRYNAPINSQDHRVRQITTNVFVDLSATPATPAAGIVISP